MKPRSFLIPVAALFLALALYGCGNGKLSLADLSEGDDGGAVEEVTAQSCRAFDVLPADADMIISLRNIKDTSASPVQTALDWAEPFWAGLMNTPLDGLPAGQLYVPSGNTIKAIVGDVFGDIALEKLGVGWNDAKCVGFSAISIDHEALNIGADAERTFIQRLMRHLGGKLSAEPPELTLQFAFDGSGVSMDMWLDALDEAIWTPLYSEMLDDETPSIVWRQITAGATDPLSAEYDEDYAAFANLTGSGFTCYALMNETRIDAQEDDQRGETFDFALQLACQAGEFWFGVLPITYNANVAEAFSPSDFTASLDSVATLEQMLVNAMNVGAQVESSARVGGLGANIGRAMEAKGADIMLLMDMEELYAGSIEGLQGLTSMFKSAPPFMRFGVGLSFDGPVAKAMFAAQFGAPESADVPRTDIMLDGTMEMLGFASMLDFAGMEIEYNQVPINMSTIAQGLMMFGDILESM